MNTSHVQHNGFSDETEIKTKHSSQRRRRTNGSSTHCLCPRRFLMPKHNQDVQPEIISYLVFVVQRRRKMDSAATMGISVALTQAQVPASPP